jgi:hypothetical protein
MPKKNHRANVEKESADYEGDSTGWHDIHFETATQSRFRNHVETFGNDEEVDDVRLMRAAPSGARGTKLPRAPQLKPRAKK